MKIDIKDNLRDAYNAFDKLKRSQVHAAAKRAINRTLVTVRKESVGVIKKGLNIKSSVLKSYITLERPNQKKISQVQGSIVYQSRGLALIDFVKGRKAPTPQKGVKVKRRKKVRVEITPGKKFVVNKGFMSNTRRGVQVMKRGVQSQSLKMQTAPSVGALLLSRKKNVGVEIQTIAQQRFVIEFQRDLNYRLTRLFNNNAKS